MFFQARSCSAVMSAATPSPQKEVWRCICACTRERSRSSVLTASCASALLGGGRLTCSSTTSRTQRKPGSLWPGAHQKVSSLWTSSTPLPLTPMCSSWTTLFWRGSLSRVCCSQGSWVKLSFPPLFQVRDQHTSLCCPQEDGPWSLSSAVGKLLLPSHGVCDKHWGALLSSGCSESPHTSLPVGVSFADTHRFNPGGVSCWYCHTRLKSITFTPVGFVCALTSECYNSCRCLTSEGLSLLCLSTWGRKARLPLSGCFVFTCGPISRLF